MCVVVENVRLRSEQSFGQGEGFNYSITWDEEGWGGLVYRDDQGQQTLQRVPACRF